MAVPRFASRVPKATDLSCVVEGARLLGLGLLPQGIRVAGLLEARRGGERMYKTAVIQMPRRATKTTSVWATILGRAATMPGYLCVTTAQSGAVASRILLEHAELMIRNGECVESREARSGSDRPVLFRSGGRERIDFPNGSRVWVVPPEAGAVRSAGADDVVIDEAGEFEGEKGQQFLQGVLPLMDTKGPLAQLVVAGTPGKVRGGMFWDQLELARARRDRETGILDFSAADSDDPEDRRVWRRVHPGPASGLTPMKVLERRRHQLGAVKFATEYLCLWPVDASVSAIDSARWAAAARPDAPMDLPERFGLAFDVHRQDASAAVCAAWRDEEGNAWVVVLEHRMGVSWLARFIHPRAKARRLPIRYDNVGSNVGPASELSRMRGVQLVPGTMKDAFAATQLLVSSLADGKLRHFDQGSLNTAVEGAAWRQVEAGRLFGWRSSTADIVPLNAAAWALWQYDQAPQRRTVTARASAHNK